MKNFYRYGLTALATSLLSANVFASSLVGVTGTLKNVEKQINVAIQTAEKLYEERGGAALDGGKNLIEIGNTYLGALQIKDDYKVTMIFSDTFSTQAKSGASVASPVAKALLFKTFVFIPIKDSGDEVITSWECITNADENVQQFIGDVGAKENTRSYIAAATTNKYLTNCIYVTTTTLSQIYSGS